MMTKIILSYNQSLTYLGGFIKNYLAIQNIILK